MSKFTVGTVSFFCGNSCEHYSFVVEVQQKHNLTLRGRRVFLLLPTLVSTIEKLVRYRNTLLPMWVIAPNSVVLGQTVLAFVQGPKTWWTWPRPFGKG